MVMISKEEGAAAAEIFPELTRDVIARMDHAQSARLRDVMEIVIRHLHAIVREAVITQGEWAQAIDDAVDNVAGPGITDSTVLGPFYAGQQRELAQGDSILLREEAGEPLAMSGRVTDPEGQPVAGALIEVWQTAPNQLYDVQDKDQPEAFEGEFSKRCGRSLSIPDHSARQLSDPG
jgi:Dioxygenase/Catechol dioxygenase N terminus